MARRPTFSSRLKELRKAAGMTKYRLAKNSGVTQQAISYLEKGRREPSWNTARLLARALGVGVEAFDVGEPKGMPKGGAKETRSS